VNAAKYQVALLATDAGLSIWSFSLLQVTADIAYGQAAEPPWFAAAMARSLAPLEDNIDEVRDMVAGLGVLAGGLDARVAGLEGLVGGLNARLAALEGLVGGLDARLAALEGLVAGLDARLAALEGLIAGLDARLAAVEGRLQALEERTAQIHRTVAIVE
jgi:uncharacterized coiled-coil protein SlyX